jgi:hypothetical protein
MTQDTRTIDEITTRDGCVTRVTEIYISHGELFLRCHQDADGDGPVDLHHIHVDEQIRVARAIILAHGMLRPAALSDRAKVVPIRDMSDIVTVGWRV